MGIYDEQSLYLTSFLYALNANSPMSSPFPVSVIQAIPSQKVSLIGGDDATGDPDPKASIRSVYERHAGA